MTFSSDVLTLERDGAVATLWLDNPDRRNAMGPAFWTDLPRAMQVFSDDDTTRVVLMAAKGPAFTVGLDLKAMGGLLLQQPPNGSDAGHRQRLFREIKRLQAAISAVADCPKPVIAAVHGYCLGGGLDLITACDIRLASADAVFSIRETKLALVADLGTLQRLPKIIPQGHVAEWVYTGKDISAERARQVGLVNEVYPDGATLLHAAQALAEDIAANSPLAVQGAKAVMRAAEGRTVEEALDYVALWNTSFLHSKDLTEAVTAFMEKRTPVFRGE
ncbi:MAG: crotonase/enoyl-CoA hydratase family protein [Rhodothermales bacterium]